MRKAANQAASNSNVLKGKTLNMDFYRGRFSNPVASQDDLEGEKRKTLKHGADDSDARSEETIHEDVWLFQNIGEVGMGECFG